MPPPLPSSLDGIPRDPWVPLGVLYDFLAIACKFLLPGSPVPKQLRLVGIMRILIHFMTGAKEISESKACERFVHVQ